MKINLDTYDAVMFDLDMTLVETHSWIEKRETAIALEYGGIPMEDGIKVWDDFLAGYEKTCHSTGGVGLLVDWMEYFIKETGMRGVSAAELVAKYYAPDSIVEVHGKCDLMCNVDVVLKKLYKMKKPMAIVTMQSIKAVDTLFSKNKNVKAKVDLVKIFGNNVITAECVEKSKPHPEPYLRAAKMLGVDIKRCLVFEDSFEGVTSAKSAGETVCWVTTEKNIVDKPHIKALADFIITDYNQV